MKYIFKEPRNDGEIEVEVENFKKSDGTGEMVCPNCKGDVIGEGWIWRCTCGKQYIGPLMTR